MLAFLLGFIAIAALITLLLSWPVTFLANTIIANLGFELVITFLTTWSALLIVAAVGVTICLPIMFSAVTLINAQASGNGATNPAGGNTLG